MNKDFSCTRSVGITSTHGLALLRSARPARSHISPIVAPPTARVGLAQWQLKRVTAHIDENLASPIQVRELAAMSRLSTSYFSRTFKKTTGATPYAFITQKRLARACELMTTTEESLCQIAIACGLCDQAHLCRVFRRIVGEAPSTWRRANATGPNTIDLATAQIARAVAMRTSAARPIQVKD